MDIVDIAQQQQQTLLDRQLANIRQASDNREQTLKNRKGDYECIDCGEPVEVQRVKVGLTLRCLSCQRKYEQAYHS